MKTKVMKRGLALILAMALALQPMLGMAVSAYESEFNVEDSYEVSVEEEAVDEIRDVDVIAVPQATAPESIVAAPSAGIVAAITAGINPGSPTGVFYPSYITGDFNYFGEPITPVTPVNPGLVLTNPMGEWRYLPGGGAHGTLGTRGGVTELFFTFTGTGIDLLLERRGYNPGLRWYIAPFGTEAFEQIPISAYWIFDATTPPITNNYEVGILSHRGLTYGTYTIRVFKPGWGDIGFPGFTVFNEEPGGGGTLPSGFNPGSPTGTAYRAYIGMYGLELVDGHGFAMHNSYIYLNHETTSTVEGDHALLFGFYGTGIRFNVGVFGGNPNATYRVLDRNGNEVTSSITDLWGWNYDRVVVDGLPRGEYILEVTIHAISETNLRINEFIVFDAGTGGGGFTYTPGQNVDYVLRLGNIPSPGYDWSTYTNFGDDSLVPGNQYRMFASVATSTEFSGQLVARVRYSWHGDVTATMMLTDVWQTLQLDFTAISGWNPMQFTGATNNTGGLAFYYIGDIVIVDAGDNVVYSSDFTGPVSEGFSWGGSNWQNGGTGSSSTSIVPFESGTNEALREVHWVRGGNLDGFRAPGGISGTEVNNGWWRAFVPELGAGGPWGELVPPDSSGFNALRLERGGIGSISPAAFEFDFYGTGIEIGVSSRWTGATITVNVIPYGGSASDIVASATLTHRYDTGFYRIETLTTPDLMYLPLGHYTLRGTVTNHPSRENHIYFSLINFVVHDESAQGRRVAITQEPANTELVEGFDGQLVVEAAARGVLGTDTVALTYQWYAVDNTAGANPVALTGATNPALDLSVFPHGTHHFQVVVSGTVNGTPLIEATSRVAVVNIWNPVGRTFFISPTGNDANDGLSPATAWQTVGRVNGFVPNIRPGDSFLFERGGVWVNPDIAGQGSSFLTLSRGGSNGAFVTLGAYGDTNLPKPVLNGSGRHNTIYISNAEYIRIENMRIINNSVTDGIPQRNRRGIFIGAWAATSPSNGGDRWFRGFEFINIEITNIDGWVRHVYGMNDSHRMNPIMNMYHLPASLRSSIQGNWWGSAVMEFNTGSDDGALGAGFRDVLIEGSYFFDFGSYGIRAAGDSHSNHHHDTTSRPDGVGFIYNFWMRNSVMRNSGQDSFNVLGGSAEFNAFYDNALYYVLNPQAMGGPQWEWTGIAYVSDGSIHQFNEYTRAWYDGDSMSLDADLGSVGTVLIQYNYSHNMDGGFWMQWPTHQNRESGAGSDGPDMDAVIIRYNMIVNDGGYWGYGAVGARSGNMDVFDLGDSNALVYNNTIFKNNGFWIGIGNNMPRVGHPTTTYGQRNPVGQAAHFINNIFVAENVGGISGQPVAPANFPGLNLVGGTISQPPTRYDDAAWGVSGPRVVGVDRRQRAPNIDGSGILGGRSAGEVLFNNNAFWSDAEIHMGAPDRNGLFVDPMFVGLGGTVSSPTGIMPTAPGFYTAKWDAVGNPAGPVDMTNSLHRTLINHIGTQAILTDSAAVVDGLRYLAAPFQVANNSPLVGAGIEVTEAFALSLVPDMCTILFNFNNNIDFFGNPRVVGGPPTIGAHEPPGGTAAGRAVTPEVALVDADGTAILITNFSAINAANGVEVLITPGDGQWHVYNPAVGVTGLRAMTEYSIQIRHIDEPGRLPSLASDAIETSRRGLSSALPMAEAATTQSGNNFSFNGVGFEVVVDAPGTFTVTMGGQTRTVNAVPGAVYYFDIPDVDENGPQTVTVTSAVGITVTGFAIMIPPTPVLGFDPFNPMNVHLGNLDAYDAVRFGPLQFSTNGGAWVNYSGTISGIVFNPPNTVRVRFAGNDFYITSAVSLNSEPHDPSAVADALPIPYAENLPPAPVRVMSAYRGPGDNWDENNFITWDGFGPITQDRGQYSHWIMGGVAGDSYTVNFRGTAIEVTAHLQYNHTQFMVVLNGELVGYYDLRRLGNPAPGLARRLNFRIDGLEYGDHVLEARALAGSWAQVDAVIIYGDILTPPTPTFTVTGNVARIANIAEFETQSRHVDLDGTEEWVFGQLQFSLNGGAWTDYTSAGIAGVDPDNFAVRVRYAGTNRPVGDNHIYRFANFDHSRESLPGGPGVSDREDLGAALQHVRELNHSDFTRLSWALMHQVYQQAAALYNNAQATAQEIEDMTDRLWGAIDNLILTAPPLPVVDKNPLIAAIEYAETFVVSQFTRLNWVLLQDALNHARLVVGNANATQDQVNAALSRLNATIDNRIT